MFVMTLGRSNQTNAGFPIRYRPKTWSQCSRTARVRKSWVGLGTRLIYIHASTLDSVIAHSHIFGDPDYPGDLAVRLLHMPI